MSTTIPRDITLPTLPVKVRYTGHSANIAFYEFVGQPDGVYLEVLRSDDMYYKRDNRPRRSTVFFFKLWVHNGKKRWREVRWSYTPTNKLSPGPLPQTAVRRQVNDFLRGRS